MIGTLRGIVTDVGQDFFILDVHGVGYRLRAHTGLISGLESGKERTVYIHEHIREDSDDLFAFATMDELLTFESLLDVSGVGPKAALAVSSAASPEALRSRLAQGDVDWLASLPGLGKKTAQKIVLELKGKLVEPGNGSDADREVVDALVNLGYSAYQARQAIKNIPDKGDSSERVRAALKSLGR